jgi:hypothetical protein
MAGDVGAARRLMADTFLLWNIAGPIPLNAT